MHYHKRACLSVRQLNSSIGMYKDSLRRNYEGWGGLLSAVCSVSVTAGQWAVMNMDSLLVPTFRETVDCCVNVYGCCDCGLLIGRWRSCHPFFRQLSDVRLE